MDTSETYIKLCEKAKEIQALRSHDEDGPQDGDCWSVEDDRSGKKRIAWIGEETIYDYSCEESEIAFAPLVWLPRQDQLQEMVGGFGQARVDWRGWLEHTYAGLGYGNPFDTSRRFNSFEQEWLAFVMKECYNKIWATDKEDWVIPN